MSFLPRNLLICFANESHRIHDSRSTSVPVPGHGHVIARNRLYLSDVDQKIQQYKAPHYPHTGSPDTVVHHLFCGNCPAF